MKTKMALKSQVIFMAALVGSLCILYSAHARPQQFSPTNWNQFPSTGNQWTAPNPQNPFFPSQQTRPQRPNSNGGQGSASTTTPVPATATTASPAFLACMQRCGSTMEYNPVCGSDGINYHNNGRLSCAAQCGKSVVATRMGTCSPL